MTLVPEGRRFRLQTAVLFTAEVTGAGDAHHLVGKVKDLAQVAALGGEHVADSVVLGDHAYSVVEGLVGEPLGTVAAERADAEPASPERSTDEKGGEARPSADVDLLARFLLESTKT